MRHRPALLTLIAFAPTLCTAESAPPTFTKLRLTDQFYCEGAYYADFNRDGKTDIVSGPFWYEGPDFRKKHQVRPAKAFDPVNYSDNFLTYTGDFNGDGWADIFYVPFPGAAGFWYENPGADGDSAGEETAWKQHRAFEPVDNESPLWGDLNGDGRPELVFNANGHLGYATYDPAKPEEPWTFHAISPKADYQRFTHGIGFGDVNGDGRTDLLEGGGWWEQPAGAKPGDLWTKHPFRFADAACQMYVYDVDGDGRNDVITVWHCHRYGLLWWKQVRGAEGRSTGRGRSSCRPRRT